MIITKERLESSYIENDFGVLREKFVKLAKSYEYDIVDDEDLGWLNCKYILLTGWGVTTRSKLPKYSEQLTLEDFLLHEKALESSVSNSNVEEHIHTDCDVKRSTEAHTPHSETPAPLIVEDGSVCDTRKDIFKEILTLARENSCFIQFDGFTDEENDSIVVTFVSSDDEYTVKSIDEFRELVGSINATQKFLRKG